ncbi:hypothetical protein JCM6882_002674 [Rhodosporidiobolus microsporus]
MLESEVASSEKLQSLSLDKADSLADSAEGVSAHGTTSNATESRASDAAPTPLLSLPDELILRIYEVLLSLHPGPPLPEHGPKHTTNFLLPLALILLNRRIYAVALPIRQRSLFLHGHVSRRPSPLFPSDQLTRFAPHVRSLDVSISRAFPSSLSASLPSFSSLHTLRLSVQTHLPAAFTDALKSLTTLRELYLRYEALPPYARAEEPDTDDPAFSIGRDLPFLTSLTIDTAHYGGEDLLLRPGGCARLKEVRVKDQMPQRVGIPWATAEKVELWPPNSWLEEWPELIKHLQSAIERPAGFAVKSLTLNLHLLCSIRPPSPTDSSSSDYAVPALLSLLQHPGAASLETLDFMGMRELDWSEEDGVVRLPGVREVRVEEVKGNWQSEQSRSSLPSFLAIFPSLTTLHLTGYAILPPPTVKHLNKLASSSSSSSSSPTIALPSPATLVETEPELKKLLDELSKKETFVELRYRAMKEWEVELRFVRRKGDEGGSATRWEGEWWWL